MRASIAQSVECSLGKAEVTGSIPVGSTNDVSVRTNKTDRYKNQSEKNLVDFFCCLKTILKSSKRKDGV